MKSIYFLLGRQTQNSVASLPWYIFISLIKLKKEALSVIFCARFLGNGHICWLLRYDCVVVLNEEDMAWLNWALGRE